jgi:hypothetical protein
MTGASPVNDKTLHSQENDRGSFIMNMRKTAVCLCLTVTIMTPAFADFMVYPAQGQSNDQMLQDKAECQRWATEQSGFNPLSTPTASTPPPAAEEPVGGAGRGALRGAAGGALVGAIAGDTRRGAAIGAGSGALLGGLRRSDQRAREDAARDNWEQQEVARVSQQRNDFNRAYQTCLQGRGYTVN